MTGRQVAYVDQEAYISSGTIRDGLLYGLKHYPRQDGGTDGSLSTDWEGRRVEAERSGNSPFDIHADWIDYKAIGADEEAAVTERAVQALISVGLENDVFQLGLRRIIDPDKRPEIVEGVLAARKVIHQRLDSPMYKGFVEVFDKESYNSNATVAENILFGTPMDDRFDFASLGRHPYILDVLERIGLRDEFLDMGRQAAAVMVDLFQDLPPGHEFFERFSFIESDDLPEFQRILTLVGNKGMDALDEEDRNRLMDLPFKLIPSRHRLDLLGEEMLQRLLKARTAFAENLPEDLQGSVEFFDIGSFNKASNILDNALFGKIATDKPESGERISELVTEVIGELGLRTAILEVGLDFNVGIAGKRLSTVQRQKLAIARSLIKRPQIMVVNEATAALDGVARKAVFRAIKDSMKDRGLIWVNGGEAESQHFDRVLTAEGGRVKEVRTGEAAETAKEAEAVPVAGEGDRSTTGLGQEAELLASIPFFAGMDRSQLKLLAFASEKQSLASEEVLFHQGDLGEKAYVVVDGTVDIIAITMEGPIKVAQAGRGDVIGELALLCDAPRTATIQAVDDVTVLRISKDVFLKLLEDIASVGANLARIIAGKLEAMMHGIGGSKEQMYDPVTGLPNRNLFMDRVQQAVSMDKRGGKISALILMKFDELAERVEARADEEQTDFLKELSHRLKGCLREADTLARLDSFTFGVIARNTHGSADTDLVLQRIRKTVTVPFAVGEEEITLSSDLTIDVYPLDDKFADQAPEVL